MNSDSKLVPFIYSSEKTTPIYAMDFYGDYVFAGVSNSGLIIRSKDRYSWEKFYQTQDINITALKVFDGYLYIGTSLNCNIYRINLSTMYFESFTTLGSEIVDFAVLNGEIYAATNGIPSVIKFNKLTSCWDFIYTPYAPVKQMVQIGDAIYLSMEASNIVVFNGTKWLKFLMNGFETNISSFDKIFRANSHGVLTHPANPTSGINCIDQDGDSIVAGASNFTRLYRFDNAMGIDYAGYGDLDASDTAMYLSGILKYSSNVSMIMNTEGDSIENILNIDVGANLVSSGNKVFLIYSGEIKNNETSSDSQSSFISTTTTTTIVNPDKDKTVVITYPNGEEQIQLGSTVNIQWSSTKSINDAIKIELLYNDKTSIIINEQTANNGSYFWDVPLSLAEGKYYKVRITWLASGDSSILNTDSSNATFTILQNLPQSTTTTTTIADLSKPYADLTSSIPVLILPEYESITEIIKDYGTNGILIGTSNGRILSCSELTINGYLTGCSNVFADVYDGCGYVGTASSLYGYSLYKKMAEIDTNKVIKSWKFGNDVTASKSENIVASFQGPVINVLNDFGFWEELMWEETKSSGSEVTIFLRTATSSEQLLNQPWIYSATSDGEYGTITRSLNNVGLNGRFLQVKVEMKTNIVNVTPSVANITIKYSSRNSSYFFTNKFSIDQNNPLKKGLITATINQPPNTEIQFGVSGENTSDWNKYQVVERDKFFDLNNKDVKIGVKFTSYDESLPEVSEFAIIAGGEVLKPIT